jgi:chemotaxis protein methyltransferase CheR
MAILTQPDMSRLRELITRYSGLGGFLQADETLQRAVAVRLAAVGMSELSEYWPLLQQPGSQEMDQLVQLVANKETFFFREMHHFELLRDRILPELLAARKFQAWPEQLPESQNLEDRGPLRLWSAGCGTGEEAYSLAIILLECQKRYGELEAVITATDIDISALEAARRGCYGERSVRLVPGNLLRQYFAFDGQTFHITPEAARLVSFQHHNLAEEHFPPQLGNMDVIFCRNVTTFFDPAARDRLNTRLAASLREGGYLFVASTETMGHNRGQLELFPVGNTLLLRKRGGGEGLMPALPPDSPAPGQRASNSIVPDAGDAVPNPQSLDPLWTTSAASESQSPETWLHQAHLAFQRRDYVAALSALEQIPTAEPVVLEAYGLRAAVLIQQGHLAEAETACQHILAHNPWDVDAHFLMGLIALHLDQVDAAVQSFKTAVYLQPEHRWAHFYLGQAYQAQELNDKARREFTYTLNILGAIRGADKPTAFNLSGIDDDALRQACQENLAKLQ